MTYAAWLVENTHLLRSQLWERGFPPAHQDVDLHHVTYEYPGTVEPAPARTALVVGYVAGDGVDCLVVEVNGTTHRASDGGTFHITYSLAEGHAPVESNVAIETRELVSIDPPISVTLTPAVLG